MLHRTRIILAAAIAAIAAPAWCAQVVTQPFQGITLVHRTETSPRKLDIYVAIIDTLAPGIQFHVSPESTHAADMVVAQTTRSFVTQKGAQLGINAGFYSSPGSVNGLPHRDPSSFAASAGNVYSAFGANEPGFNIGKNNVAHRVVAASQTEAGKLLVNPSVPIYNAVGGWANLINNGNVTTSWPEWQMVMATALHPRTAMGLSADRRYVTMFTVDGRQAHSGGMTFVEMGNMLKNDYGAHWAINLDGGGSTTMVIADSTPRVLNKPSEGAERAVGNSWAVSARPTPPTIPANALSRGYSEQAGSYSHGAAQLRSAMPTTNYGATDSFRVGYHTTQGKTRGALSFDLTNIPANAIVHSVSLTLDAFESSGTSGYNYVDLELFKLSKSVVESEVTWNQNASGTNWTQPGGDVSGRSLSSLFGQQSTGLKTFVSTVDFVAAAQAAVSSGSPLNLLVAALDAELRSTNLNLRFRSDDATIGQRPMLTVQYTFTPLPGDFNGDGFIDATDYVVWRQSNGSQQGYDAWRTNFSKTGVIGSGQAEGAQVAVPEASSAVLVALALATLTTLRDRSRNYRGTNSVTRK